MFSFLECGLFWAVGICTHKQNPIRFYQYLLMSSNDYLDRLRSIREKYGCAQGSNIPKPRIPEAPLYSHCVKQSDPLMGRKNIQTDPRNKRQMDLGRRQPFRMVEEELGQRRMDQNLIRKAKEGSTRRTDKDYEIEKIRSAYAESRRQVMEDFAGRHQAISSGFRGEENKAGREPEAIWERTSPRPQTAHFQYSPEDVVSVSPIKRVNDLIDLRPSHDQGTSWRGYEMKLSEIGSNRIKQESYSSQIKNSTRKSNMRLPSSNPKLSYTKPGSENSRPASTSQLGGSPKKYSVSNIDRIQQRIQSILGGR